MTTQDAEIRDIARRLIAGAYHNPEHIARIRAEQPVMPDAATTSVWDAMLSAEDGGTMDAARVDALTRGEPDARALINDIRNANVLTDLEAAQMSFRGEQLERYAVRLAERAMKIQLATRLGALASRIAETDAGIDEIAAGIVSDTMRIAGRNRRSSMSHISEYTDDAVQDVDEWSRGIVRDVIPTGFFSVDEIIGGLPVGELTVFASMSGMGKTSFLVQLIRQIAQIYVRKNEMRAACLFSIEMSAKQIIHRAAAQIAQSNIKKMRGGGMTSRPGGKLVRDVHVETIRMLEELPIYIDPDPRPTMDQMYSRTLQIAAEHDVALIGIDYDEKVDVDEYREEQRVARIAEGSKVLAKRIGAACVNLSQYNSAPATQMRPGTDNDLRYSRKKKHEASVILHWYWPEYFIRNGDVDLSAGDAPPPMYDASRPNAGQLRVSKAREAGTGTARLFFYPEHTRFVDPKEPKR